MLIKLGKTALAGLTVVVGKIDSRLIHGLNDHVKGDLSASVKEVCKGECVYGAHCRNGVSLDAGNLNETANGVAGKPEMMLHCNLCRVFYLVNTHFKKLTKSG